jgi:hypothetical protein
LALIPFGIKAPALIAVATLALAIVPLATPEAETSITSHTITVATEPDAFVAAGSDIWVTGCSSNSVTANSIDDGAR